MQSTSCSESKSTSDVIVDLSLDRVVQYSTFQIHAFAYALQVISAQLSSVHSDRVQCVTTITLWKRVALPCPHVENRTWPIRLQ